MLRRLDRLARFLDDGRICLSNDAAGAGMRGAPWRRSPVLVRLRLLLVAASVAAVMQQPDRHGQDERY